MSTPSLSRNEINREEWIYIYIYIERERKEGVVSVCERRSKEIVIKKEDKELFKARLRSILLTVSICDDRSALSTAHFITCARGLWNSFQRWGECVRGGMLFARYAHRGRRALKFLTTALFLPCWYIIFIYRMNAALDFTYEATKQYTGDKSERINEWMSE